MRTVGRNAQLGAGVLHRLFLRVAVAHHHHRAIVRVQSRSARGFAIRRDDLAGMRMVGGDDHRGITVFSREFQRLLHRFVKINRFADLAARIGRMVLLIDGSAFDLQEETFRCDSAGQSLSVICASVGTEASRFGFGVQVTGGLSILP